MTRGNLWAFWLGAGLIFSLIGAAFSQQPGPQPYSAPSAPLSYYAASKPSTAGLAAFTFPGGIFSTAPVCTAQAVGPNPQAGVTVNTQTEGAPTTSGVSIRVTQSTATLVGLLSLTISVINTPGNVVVHVFCVPAS